MTEDRNISRKANRVLNFILLCMLLILIRIWYLAVVQHEEQIVQAYKPQRKSVIEPAERATIHDRFNLPLAINKIQYNAAVCYANIREIPSTLWKKDETGKNICFQARIEHIKALSFLLAKELNMDPIQIEDMIYGKASLFPHTPFVIREDISEEQYFRLRMMEKDWIGIQMQRAAKRFYPQGKVSCDILGYLGAMSQKKYLDIANETRELEAFIAAREKNENPFLPKGFDHPLQVRERLQELQEKGYTINDLMGKSGIEGFYEEELRGSYGKKIYEVDVKGNFLHELPGSRPVVSGRRLVLSISAELQAFAESLLAANEGLNREETTPKLDEQWMKGGAVIAMIPKTGEVVALASYPRFDPNDFIPTHDPDTKKEKETAVQKWLENLAYIAEIWDGKLPLQREIFSFLKGGYEEESFFLSWNHFLEAILPSTGPIKEAMMRIGDLHTAIRVQEEKEDHPILKEIRLKEDKTLLVDLCRLSAKKELFSTVLLEAVGTQSLYEYHFLRQAALRIQKETKLQIEEFFHNHDFASWRKLHFKEHLKRKRKEEKLNHTYTHPYTEYLDQVERKLFQAFWGAYRSIFLYCAISGRSPISLNHYPHLQPYITLLQQHLSSLQNDPSLLRLQNLLRTLHPQTALSYLQTMRPFEELTDPLLGHYTRLRSDEGKQLEKHLAAAFYPLNGYGFGRSQAYRQTSAQGSVFKLVTAYQVLLERYTQKKDLNPLTLIDNLKGDRKSKSNTQVLGYTLDGQPILRLYRGGQLPRSSHSNIGQIDLLGALEQSSNLYFAIIAGDHIKDPTQLANTAKLFGFGEKTGIDLPAEVKGSVSEDLATNKTGLYSFAIGQHSLTASPLQTTLMVSTIANKGDVIKPKVVKIIEGKKSTYEEESLFSVTKFPFQEALSLVGIDFPLFTATQNSQHLKSVYHTPIEVKRSLFFPKEIHQMITEGMRRAVSGERGTARPSIMRNLYNHPSTIKDCFEMKNEMIAKTGTAQFRYKQTLDSETPAEMKKNVWFAAISYPSDKEQGNSPELVVVVFLKFRESGRDGGPIAAQVIKRWREICRKYEGKLKL